MHYVVLQNVLTFTLDSLLIGSTAYLSVGLALRLKQKWDALEVLRPVEMPPAPVPLLESRAIPVDAVAIPEKVAIPLKPIV